MSNKKNLPNIPLYTGDWERDCNVLSLEAEAAWLRIIMKLWTAGKQNTYKATTKALQNLWRCSPEKVLEIIMELELNNICDITKISDTVEIYAFTCRRFVKENQISEKRRQAVESRYQSETNKHQIQNTYKPSTKHIQTPENENEIVINNEIKNDNRGDARGESISQTQAEPHPQHQQLCQAFGVNEIKNFTTFRRLDHFLHTLTDDQADYHHQQLEYYLQYKQDTRQALCNPITWIESHWNRQDYRQLVEKQIGETVNLDEL